MKLNFAGVSSPQTLTYTNYLFNCQRNKKCQKEFFIPLASLSDLQFYADLPGRPESYEVSIFDSCQFVPCPEPGGDFSDDFSDDFANGTPCTEGLILYSAVTTMTKYVIGQKPNGGYYGVFGSPIYTDPISTFFFRFIFTINGIQYVYYSEQFSLDRCEQLTYVRGCYPNELPGSQAFDCNGIYYGYHSGTGSVMGSSNYRYFHWGYVRKGSVTETISKLSFGIFNSKRVYKQTTSREKLFEFELVPGFYKDHLLGIFARGQVQINGTEYLLSEEQSWSVLDRDNKLWQMDVNLTEECNSFFGCKPASCEVLPETCCNPSNVTASVSSELPPTCCNPSVLSANVRTVPSVVVPGASELLDFSEAQPTLDICAMKTPLVSLTLWHTLTDTQPNPDVDTYFATTKAEACNAKALRLTDGSRYQLKGNVVKIFAKAVGENVWISENGCMLYNASGYFLDWDFTTPANSQIIQIGGGIIIDITTCP